MFEQAFKNIDDVLHKDAGCSHYISVGVEELEQVKLAPLLKLRYNNSINDAVADLGEDIGEAFTGFQKYLYQGVA
jgi:type I restriction enzyme, R subunit